MSAVRGSPLQWSLTIVKDDSQGVNMSPDWVLTCRRNMQLMTV